MDAGKRFWSLKDSMAFPPFHHDAAQETVPLASLVERESTHEPIKPIAKR
jgi:hypothetical protein